MPKKEPTEVTTTKILTKANISVAIITLLGTLVIGYWQFVAKPNAQGQTKETQYVGRVTDAISLLPISGAKVTLELHGVPPVVYTDSEGVYQFKLLTGNTVSGKIRVDAERYETYTRNIALVPDLSQIDDIRLVQLMPTAPIENPTSIGENTNIEIATSTSIPTATTITPATVSDVSDQLTRLVDDYYACLNFAKPNDDDDRDYEACWNMLSDRPGEFQSHLNKNDFISFWKKYKISYALFYCPKNIQNNVQHFVHARYYLYERSNDSIPIRSAPYYLEFLFAHSDQGWRIEGANDDINDIGSFCENNPRIDKLTPPS